MIEIVLALAIAGVSLFFLFSAFAGASTGSVAPLKKAKAAQQPKKEKASKQQKKEKARAAREEAEMERLVAAQAVSVSGMTTDKAKVMSLEDVKTQDKKPEPAKKSGNRSTQQSAAATQQRLLDQQQGFQVVERKEKAASPTVTAQRDAEREKDRDLSRFFRNQDKKGKRDRDDSFQFGKGKSKSTEREASPKGVVVMKKKLTSDPSALRDAWAEREN